jgi:tRNA G10  N-methylase Trm11
MVEILNTMVENSYLFFLGSHPDISATEAWRIFEHKGYEPRLVSATKRYLHVNLNQELPDGFIDHLGGTERIAHVLAAQSDIFSVASITETLALAPNTKLKIGVSSLGTSPEYARRVGHDIKDSLRNEGHRVRVIIPKKGQQRLNSASVLFNRLTTLPHRELTVIKDDEHYLLSQTIQVQDITKYELRDTMRPARDAKVGMLPPKLAQMMLNFALSHLSSPKSTPTPTVYDPFCGIGTILQESWLMGFQSTGSDSSERMVRATQKNLDWLAEHFPADSTIYPKVLVQDATRKLPTTHDSLFTRFDAIVTEPFLGNPISAPLPENEVGRRVEDLGNLYHQMLKNAHSALSKDGAICMALPAWKAARQSVNWHLFPDAFLDDVEAIGYHRNQLIPAQLHLVFPASPRQTLLYARPDANVGRELILWTKR